VNGLPGTAADVNYYVVSIRMVFLADYFLCADYQDLEVNQFDIIDVEVAREMSITDNQKMPFTRLPRQVKFAAP
jgi:hypothetical protein